MQDDDDNDDPMILNIRAKNHTLERTIVPWTVIFSANMHFPTKKWGPINSDSGQHSCDVLYLRCIWSKEHLQQDFNISISVKLKIPSEMEVSTAMH